MSRIDDYLDELFTRLKRAGSPGRRLLVEAEDHLRSATAHHETNGLSNEVAEQRAIAEFGTPRRVARHVKDARGRRTSRRILIAVVSCGVLLIAAAAGLLAYDARVVLPRAVDTQRSGPPLAVELIANQHATLAQDFLLLYNCSAGRTVPELVSNKACLGRYGSRASAYPHRAYVDLSRCLARHGDSVGLTATGSVDLGEPSLRRALEQCQGIH